MFELSQPRSLTGPPPRPFRLRAEPAGPLLERHVRQLVEAHADAPEVPVVWRGNAPLEYFRRAVELVERSLRPGQRAAYTLKFDAAQLDEEWIAFFREHGFLVELSIDGDHVVDVLRDAGVEWRAVTPVRADNADRGRQVYRFLRDDCGATSVEFVPERSITGAQYGRFLIDVFEEWVRRDVGRVSVQMFDAALANWAGEPPALCVHSETCGDVPALDGDGDLYSCDRFVEPAHKLGNITMTHMLKLVDSPQQRGFGFDKRDTLPRFCLHCDVRFACHGGCPKDRIASAPTGEAGLNYLCDGYKEFFHHIDTPMQLMATWLRQGRAPAQIMSLYRAADAQRDRDEPCPCRSGRKWKRCHGVERPLELVR